MDSEWRPKAPATTSPTRPRQQHRLLQREQAARQSPAATQEPQSWRDARLRRSPTKPAAPGAGSAGGAGLAPARPGPAKPKTLHIFPGDAARPTLAAAERGNRGDGPTAKQGSLDDDKWDMSPDGVSGGRAGRQFAVANVGNNGRIYLRPTARPANQRYPWPQFVFPTTPPSTAGLDGLMERCQDAAIGNELPGSPCTGPHGPPTTMTAGRRAGDGGLLGYGGRRRAVSDTTITEAGADQQANSAGFKVVITQAGGDGPKPQTVDDLDPAGPPLLNVTIPSWRIGTPRFSVRGTPFIRGSSCAPTEDMGSGSASLLTRPGREATPSAAASPDSSFKAQIHSTARAGVRLRSPVSPRLSKALLSSHLSASAAFEPAMFDALTLQPACDDKAVIRYSPTTGAVTAATPSRLVAEITSPSFLDYELLSDFFLTFRVFLEPADLLRMLIARLRWALSRSDEAGMVVRVRTFVALRHWILNYFVDDFVVDHGLRVTFCELLNNFVDELAQDARARKVQIKILAELKKCWRRVCAQYWDGPEGDAAMRPDVPIVPGGIAGHRDPQLDPSFWKQPIAGPPQLDGDMLPSVAHAPSFYADVSRAGHVDSVLTAPGPAAPHTSIGSDVVSCSLPGRSMASTPPGAGLPPAAHPVGAGVIGAAAAPRTRAGKGVGSRPKKPGHVHRQSGGLGYLWRTASAPDKVLVHKADLLLTQPFAGSLVRGNLLPPAQPFVEVRLPTQAEGASRQTTVLESGADPAKDKAAASAMPGPGMKKLLGSARRALANRAAASGQGNLLAMAPLGLKGATANRLPGAAIVPQARPHPAGGRPAVRIDLLGAEAAQDFQKALRDDGAAEAARYFDYMAAPAAEFKVLSAACPDSAPNQALDGDGRPGSDAAITNGSKSIVIVDDTLPIETPAMAGALPAAHPSLETLADTFVSNHADPTPPNTPPGPRGTPRRSSFILSHCVLRASVSQTFLPQRPRRTASLGTATSPWPWQEDANAASMQELHRTPRWRSPLGRARGHARFPSSGASRPADAVNSLDATSASDSSLAVDAPRAAAPPPLRVLRRRPGGDLRAATNAGKLQDMGGLRGSHSVGSLTTFADSMHSSFLCSPTQASSRIANQASHKRADDGFSPGVMAKQEPKRKPSLFRTHLSKPMMRPSFETEAQRLAQIPDDDDDGGVESALLKLEGKYVTKPARRLSARPSIAQADDEASTGHGTALVAEVSRPDAAVKENKSEPAHMGSFPGLLPVRIVAARRCTVQDRPSSLSDDSTASCSSLALWQRALADEAAQNTGATQEWTKQCSVHHDLVKKMASMEKTEPRTAEAAGQRYTSPPTTEQSFFDRHSDMDSQLSSELSTQVLDATDSGNAAAPLRTQTKCTAAPATYLRGPLGRQAGFQPPSPPMTEHQGARPPFPATKASAAQLYSDRAKKPLPPTPDTTPTTAAAPPALLSPFAPTSTTEALGGAPPMDMDHLQSPASAQGRRLSLHLPFILAFDSDVLAQQFTLVEKDALNEIDWKELIDMRWKHADHTGINARSWVSFLRQTDAHGVEVVIARFNIMVKWAISEIVLTQHLEERARCIIKCIHIAAHCRRLRNFATMSQLTMALTSGEISCLSKTWGLVPRQDIQKLQELETLISPSRNFYNLRAEMEGGGSAGAHSAEMGCIPFVGIYTHDLLFNACRPSEIASSPTGTPLVNFERCRVSAAVVKTLLRLLEASTLYDFQPIEGIIERCLWMGALADEEIRRYSERLE